MPTGRLAGGWATPPPPDGWSSRVGPSVCKLNRLVPKNKKNYKFKTGLETFNQNFELQPPNLKMPPDGQSLPYILKKILSLFPKKNDWLGKLYYVFTPTPKGPQPNWEGPYSVPRNYSCIFVLQHPAFISGEAHLCEYVVHRTIHSLQNTLVNFCMILNS